MTDRPKTTLRDCIYGLAVGDALGVPYEFRPRGTFECTDMIGYGTHGQPAGTWSDDTSMTLATCDSIRELGHIDTADMRDKFVSWIARGEYTIDGVFDYGGTTARALHTGKSRAFLEESLAPCDTLDLEELIDAASKDTDTFYAYLSRTDYADGVKALKDGFSAFEKWCDDRQTALVKEISRQDYFTVAPLLGYVTARQNEISTVRIIISGKQNNLPDERIRARLRDL